MAPRHPTTCRPRDYRLVARPYTTIPLHTLSVAQSRRGSGFTCDAEEGGSDRRHVVGRRDQVRCTLWLAGHRVTAVRSTLGDAQSKLGHFDARNEPVIRRRTDCYLVAIIFLRNATRSEAQRLLGAECIVMAPLRRLANGGRCHAPCEVTIRCIRTQLTTEPAVSRRGEANRHTATASYYPKMLLNYEYYYYVKACSKSSHVFVDTKSLDVLFMSWKELLHDK